LTPTVALWRDEPIPLRDGTLTRADVWRRPDTPPVPAILLRTPYGKERAVPIATVDPAQAADAGFAVVVQDVRGKGASGGVFEPFLNEGPDGADSIAWVASQAWCDGRVVTAGMSYPGISQWLAAAERPPALRAVAPTITTDDAGEGWAFRSGVRETGFLRTWIATTLAPPDQLVLDDLDAVAESTSLDGLPAWAPAWFSEPAGSPYWAARSPARTAEVPALILAGWYDCFLAGSLRSFQRRARPDDRLIVGPWGHEPTFTHLIGERAQGYAGSEDGSGLRARVLAFYRAAVDGSDPPGPRVLAYALGARRWLELPSWPPPGTRAAEVPLAGEGSLQADPAALPAALGGRRLQGGVPGGGHGPRDQRPLLGHPGVLRLDAPAPTTRLLAAGPASVRLGMSTERGDPRQWVAILCREEPDGALINLAEGVALAAPSAPEVTVELGDVCVELPVGERLVVLVTGGLRRRFAPPASAAIQRVHGATLALTAV
jgi:predicted acyl esterase